MHNRLINRSKILIAILLIVNKLFRLREQIFNLEAWTKKSILETKFIVFV